MQLGIDFGSTYSTFASYSKIEEDVIALNLMEGDPVSIPSVVSIGRKNKKIICGRGAKDQIGKKPYRTFEAFKMLLTSDNQKMLTKQGYDEKYTPQEITRIYLEENLKGLLKRYGDREEILENVVICVPEIWANSEQTIDGRNILLNILTEKIDIPIKHVQVVTEPEAASAYFAHNFERETGKRFNGHLLLIDYGGGTLDLTLTKVSSVTDELLEIGYRESGGAGENHPDENGDGMIGSAGIAFMRSVVIEALLSGELISDSREIDQSDPDFLEAVRDLENQMKTPQTLDELENTFGIYKKYRNFQKIFQEEDCTFMDLEYGDDIVTVTYQNLFAAYQRNIESVLREEVDKICEKIIGHIGFDPRKLEAGLKDDFKIALVGGFGSCYFVKKQLAEIFDFDTNIKNDPRVKNIDSAKKEQAIALGAGLLSAGKVVLQKIPRYSIGIISHVGSGIYRIHYGIKYHQAIEPGKPYFLCESDRDGDDPTNRIPYAALQGNIKDFAMEWSDNNRHGAKMPLSKEMLSRLAKLPEQGVWNIGFSLNESDVVSLHIVPDARFPMEENMKEVVIPLENYKKMFSLSKVEEVIG